jgi:hypothetical protein
MYGVSGGLLEERLEGQSSPGWERRAPRRLTLRTTTTATTRGALRPPERPPWPDGFEPFPIGGGRLRCLLRLS